MATGLLRGKEQGLIEVKRNMIDGLTIKELTIKFGDKENFHFETRENKVFVGKDDHEHELDEQANALLDAAPSQSVMDHWEAIPKMGIRGDDEE